MSSNVFGDLVGAAVKAVGQGAKAVVDAGETFVGEWTDDVESVGEGFEEGGLAGGFFAAWDAASPGNIMQNQATALGLIKNRDFDEAMFKGIANGVLLNPIAIKDFLDAGQLAERPSDVSGQCVAPPSGYPVIREPGPAFGRGKMTDHRCFPRLPAIERKPITTRPSPCCEQPPAHDGPVTGRPVKDTRLADILNDKSLCFEDMLALAMICIVGQQQKEIADKLAEIKAMDDAAAASEGGEAGSAEEAHDPLEMAGRLLSGNLDAQSLGEVASMAKGMLPILMPIICTALAAMPPMGPLLAMAAPIVLPKILDTVEGLAASSGSSTSKNKAAASKPQTQEEKDDAKAAAERSRSLEFEALKLLTTRMSEMQQTLSNVLNTQHETSMTAIRNIRA